LKSNSLNRQTLVIAVCIILAGCSDETVQAPELTFDQQVEQEWIEGRERVNAVEFLESGGVYEDTSPDLKIDREHLLPLLRKLQDEFDLTVDALLDSDNNQIAFAIVVDLSETARHADIVSALDEADGSVPGIIQDFWGERWLSIDIMDEFETQMLEKDGHLELLRQHLAAQRTRIREDAE
jgi:hypothetical protein